MSGGAGRLVAAMFVVLLVSCRAGARSPGPPPEPDAARAFADLERQVACGPRVPGSAASRCARSHILEVLQASGARTGTQTFAVRDPEGPDSLRLANVLGAFHPERSVRVLLGAHYDSRPRADRDTGMARTLPIPGANDGASGVAVLLEVARALGRWDPGVGVDLVFLDGEDYGREGDVAHYLLGSRHYVRTMGSRRPRAMLLVDMVGDRDLEIPMEANSLERAPELVRTVFEVARALGVRSFVDRVGPAVLDDHVPFLLAGVPAVDLIDLDYPEWHTLRDTAAACSPESLAGVVRVLLHTLPRLAAGG